MKLQLPAQKSLGIANESLAEIIDLPKALPENYYKPGWYTYDISSKTWRKIKEEQDDLKTKKFHAAAEALEPITANLREISPQFRSAHLHRLDVTQATAKPGEAFNRCFNVWHTDPKKEAEVEAIFAFTQPTKFLHGEYDDPTLPDNARQDDVRVRLNEIGDERLKK
jgi:hypothetical protein